MISNGSDNMVMPVSPMYGGNGGCGFGNGWGDGWSRDYSRGYEEDYSNTYPIYKMARDNEHESGYSYRRGRDSMGRYTSRDDGYSRHSKAEMIEDLKEMMMNARTEDERESYRKTIDNLTRN